MAEASLHNFYVMTQKKKNFPQNVSLFWLTPQLHVHDQLSKCYVLTCNGLPQNYAMIQKQIPQMFNVCNVFEGGGGNLLFRMRRIRAIATRRESVPKSLFLQNPGCLHLEKEESINSEVWAWKGSLRIIFLPWP